MVLVSPQYWSEMRTHCSVTRKNGKYTEIAHATRSENFESWYNRSEDKVHITRSRFNQGRAPGNKTLRGFKKVEGDSDGTSYPSTKLA